MNGSHSWCEGQAEGSKSGVDNSKLWEWSKHEMVQAWTKVVAVDMERKGHLFPVQTDTLYPVNRLAYVSPLCSHSTLPHHWFSMNCPLQQHIVFLEDRNHAWLISVPGIRSRAWLRTGAREGYFLKKVNEYIANFWLQWLVSKFAVDMLCQLMWRPRQIENEEFCRAPDWGRRLFWQDLIGYHCLNCDAGLFQLLKKAGILWL